MVIIKRILRIINRNRFLRRFHSVASSAYIPNDIQISVPDNLVMEEGATLDSDTIILNINSKFILGRYSGAGPRLTVVTGNHMSMIGKYQLAITDEEKKAEDPQMHFDHDVVVESDVWIGANVCLLSGVHIGRGAIVAAGAVCRTTIPPYAIALGNPAKVVGFRFTPQQIIEHEILLYSPEERLQETLIEKNYKRYYLDRLDDINKFSKI